MPLAIPVDADLKARFVRRYKRFFADVETETGEQLTVHCPNPGRMQGTDRAGAAVRCSTSDNPRRKLRHTLEMMKVGRVWVGLHTLRANQLARRCLERGSVAGLSGYRSVRSEVAVEPGSRIDFLLDESRRGEPPCYVEVKSVTLALGDRGRFPDAVTERGRRHMETLAALRDAGARACVLFVVQRGDCASVEPADDVDPAYAEALREAAAKGVEVRAVSARVGPRAIRFAGELPVDLGRRVGSGRKP